jgi:hypothetical protein
MKAIETRKKIVGQSMLLTPVEEWVWRTSPKFPRPKGTDDKGEKKTHIGIIGVKLNAGSTGHPKKERHCYPGESTVMKYLN